MTDVPVSIDAERAVLGALLLTPPTHDVYLAEQGLRSSDFYYERHRIIFGAITELYDSATPIDVLTVTEHLRSRQALETAGGRAQIDELTMAAPAVSNLRSYGEVVADRARWRRRLTAGQGIVTAAQAMDGEAFQAAENAVYAAEGTTTHRALVDPHGVAAALVDAMRCATDVRWPWPLVALNRLSGGARPGQLTLISGPTTHGKSCFADMCLQSMGEAGANVALFLNEQTMEERAERMFTRLSRVPYGRIQAATAGREKLSASENRAILSAAKANRVAIAPAAGWRATDICREIRRSHLDVACIDIVQGLPYERGRRRHEVIEQAVQELDALAKDTGCHVIICGHINRERANGTWPVPGLGDIRDSAELANRPDNVLFVWREQDPDTLDPLTEGVIRVAKYRGAELKSIPVVFRGEYQEFVQAADTLRAAA